MQIKINTNQPDADEFEVSIFGPGVGESLAIHAGEGDWYLVDSFVDSSSGKPKTLDYLESLGVDAKTQVKGVVITHWHGDHTKGMPEIVGACKEADFYISAALLEHEALKLAALYEKSDIPTPRVSSDISDYAAVIELIREKGREAKVHHCQSSTTILTRTKPFDVRLIALSPSSASVNISLADIVSKTGLRRGFKSVNTPNFNSICLHFTFGDKSFLLGSDLEEDKNNKDIGWSGIDTSGLYSRLGLTLSEVLKAPHHGSETAHANVMWSNMLVEKPIVGVTRFSKSGLPREADIKRMRSRAQAVLVTSNSPKRVDRPKAAQQMIANMTSELKVLDTRIGHIQFRGKPSQETQVRTNSNVKEYTHLPEPD